MISTSLTVPGMALQALQNRGVRGGGIAFGDIMGAALNQGGRVPDGLPLSANTVNVLAQAMMAALAQVQGGWSGGISMPLLGAGAVPYRGQSLPNFPVGVMPAQVMPAQVMPAQVMPAQVMPTTLANSPATAASSPYDTIIQRAAQRYGVDEGLIRAVIQTESNFNPQAVSPVGAQGLMQLMPATAAELGVNQPLDPEENIMGGTRYLSRLLGRYRGDTRLALSAYNWGMGNLERHPEDMPGETKRYVAKIMGALENKQA